MHRKIFVATTWALLLFLGRETLAIQPEQPTYYWNPPNGGTGNWNTTDPSWSPSPFGPADQAWSNTGGTAPYDAVFGGTAGTVSLGTNITANELRFQESGYTIQSVSRSLIANGFDTGNHSTTLATALNGTNGFSKYGSGSLNLFTSSFSLTGPIRAQEGTLIVAGTNSFVLPPASTTTISAGATLQVNGRSGTWTSADAMNVVAMPNSTIRMTSFSSFDTYLNDVFLAGGAVVGNLSGSGSFDFGINKSIVTRGNTASTIDVARGISFYIPTFSITPVRSLIVNDVTRDEQSDLTITGAAVNGALQPDSSSFVFLSKSGNGTLTINARNNFYSATRYSVSNGKLRLEGANSLNRFTNNALVGVGASGVLELADTDVVPQFNSGIDLELYGGKLQIAGENTGRNHLRHLTFSAGGAVETIGAVSATSGENLRINGAILVSQPNLTRVLPASINLSHGMGSANGFNFNIGNSTMDAEADLVISGTGSLGSGNFFLNGLNKTGVGTLRIETNNTYQGATSITNGVLSVASIGNGGVASGVGQSNSDRSNLVINGGTLRYTGPTATTNRGFTATAAAIEIERADATLTWTGVSSSGTWTKLGPGTLELTASQFFSGQTSVADGILRFSGGSANFSGGGGTTIRGATGLVNGAGAGPFHQIRNGVLQLDNLTGNIIGSQTVAMQGGTLLYTPNGAGAQSTTVTNLSLASGFNTLAVAPSTGPDQLSITNLSRTSTATVEFRSQFGPLGGAGDNGRIVLTNVNSAPVNNVNGILGGWAIANNSTVDQAGTSASDWFATNLGSGNIGAFTDYAGTQTSTNAISSATSAQNWWVDGGSASTNRTLTANKSLHSLITGGSNANDGDLAINSFAVLTLGSGGLIMRGAGHTISGNGTIVSGMASGELFLHAPSDSLYDGSTRLAVRTANNGSTPGILIKDGPGEVVIDTSTSHTGGTRVHQGRLTVANGFALSNSSVTVLPGGQINVADGISANFGINLGGTGINSSPGLDSALRFAGSGFAGNVTLTSDSRIDVGGAATVGPISGSFGLEKVGPGTLQITQGANYTGVTKISEGTLTLLGSATFASSPSITIDSAGTLQLATSLVFPTSNPGNLIVNGGSVNTTNGSTNQIATLTMTGGNINTGTHSSGSSLTFSYPTNGTAILSTLPSAASATITGAGININSSNPFLMIRVAEGAANDDLVISGLLGSTSAISAVTVERTGDGQMTLSGSADNRSLRLTNLSGTTVMSKASSATVHAVGSISDALTLSGGKLQLAGTGGDQIPAITNVVVDSGVFDFNGRDESFNGLTGQSGVILNDAVGTTSTMTVGEMNGSSSWYGAVEDGAGAMAVTKVGTGTITLGGHNTFSGGARVLGGTLKFEGTLADSSSQNVQVAVDPDGNFATAGPTIVFERLRNDSYAGLGSQAIGGFNSQADLLAGANLGGTDVNVTMQWRTRSAAESTVPTIPPLPLDGVPLASDVLNLTGMVNNQLPSGQSDVFVLQMSYSTADLGGFSESALVLGWLDPNGAGIDIPQWRAAIDGNYGTNSGTRFAGSWQAAGNPLTLGAWGIDTTKDVVWAVLNHNSQFAVIPVPEPTAALLAWLAATSLLGWSRRRKFNR